MVSEPSRAGIVSMIRVETIAETLHRPLIGQRPKRSSRQAVRISENQAAHMLWRCIRPLVLQPCCGILRSRPMIEPDAVWLKLVLARLEIERHTAYSWLRDGLWASTNVRNGPNGCLRWPIRPTPNARRASNAPALTELLNPRPPTHVQVESNIPSVNPTYGDQHAT